MKHSRRSFGACLMSDGKVLVCGGMGSDGKRLSSVECYDPSTNAWVDLPPLLQVRLRTSCQSLTEIFADADGVGWIEQPREEFGCARLSDGRIAVCGGSGDAVLETKDNNITTSYSVKEGEEKTITTNVPTTTRRLAGLASYKVRLRLRICRSHASFSRLSSLWFRSTRGRSSVRSAVCGTRWIRTARR